MTRTELLAHLRQHKLATIATINDAGAPAAALIGIALTDAFDVVFDTLSTTRKHRNMLRESRVALVFAGPGEQTVQYEGCATLLQIEKAAAQTYTDAYFQVWPDGRDRLSWPDISYWRVIPTWIRYTRYSPAPHVAELSFEI